MKLGRVVYGALTYASLVLVLSTCDMADVLSTPKKRTVALAFEGDSTIVMASGVRPSVRATIEGAPIIDPAIRFSSSDTTVVAISTNGDSLIARRLGKAVITATLEGTLLPSPLPTGVDTIYVVPKEFSLDRNTVAFSALGDTIRLVATAIDALNRSIPNIGVVWSSSDPDKASVSPTGLVTGKANTGSPVTITAQLEGIAASAEVSVAQEIARFAFEPSTISFDALGAQSTVTVSARDRNNNPMPSLPAIGWTSGNAAIVSVHPTNGTLVSLDNGSTYIRATAMSGTAAVSDTVHVEVNQQATRVSIFATADTSINAIGGTLKLDGRAYDRLNSEVKKRVSWSSLDGDIAGVDTVGLVTGRGTGNARILARVDTATKIQVISVTNNAVRLTLDPTSATLASANDSLVLSVRALNALGIPIANPAITWRSTDSTIVKVLAPGLVRAERAGTANIIASSGTMTATATINVTNAPAFLDLILPAATLGSIGDSIAPAVSLRNARGDELDRTSVTWSSDLSRIADVSVTGVIYARDSGTTKIRASSGSLRDSILITVTNAPASIVLNRSSDALTAIGQTLAYSAVVRNGAGNEIPGFRITWRSSDVNVVTISSTGVATAIGEGTAQITGQAGSVVGTATIVVTNVPASVTIAPKVASVTSVGDALQLSATVANSLGATIPGAAVTWTTPDGAVATLSATGLLTSTAVGVARVIATSNGRADTATVTISNSPDQVNIVPEQATLSSVNDSLVPALQVTNARGAALSASSLLWSSDDAAVARVTATGIIIATGSGATFIKAVSPTNVTRRDSILITVTNAPAMVVLNDTRDTLTAIGRTRTYTSTVRNARGALLPGAIVTWTSGSTAIATVVDGTVTAQGVGSTLITAQSGSATAQVDLTVTNNAVSLVLTPPTASITAVGDALTTLQATARNELDAPIAGAAISWRTPDVTVVEVQANGTVVALSVGTARVIASSGLVADTTIVTVTNVAEFVDIVPTSATLASVGDTLIPDIIVRNSRNALLDRGSVTWSVEDPAVLRVTTGGIVIAKDAGSSYVYAVSPGNSTKRDSVLVTVTNAPAAVVLNDFRDTLTAVGRVRTYAAEVRNARGAVLSDAIVSWSSTAEGVASVLGGTATANGVGTALIIAQSGTKADTVELTVTNDPVSLDLPATLAISSLGDVAQLSATARNDLGNVIPGSSLVWSSTIPSIASVDGTGKVTGIAVGTARVIAAAGLLADTTVVTVTNNPATIAIAPDTVRLTFIPDSIAPAVTLANGRGVALPATSATWSADDPTIARVSSTGMITARDTGTTIVRATSGIVTDAVVVVVTNAPGALVLDATRDTLTAPGQTISFSAAVTNVVGRPIVNPSVVWTSTNGSVATVTGAGEAATVTSVGFGSTLIIATSAGKADTIQLAVVNPTVLYVDNSVFTSVRTGTMARPYAKIQDAVNAAGTNDTVLVRKGSGPYEETVGLSRRIFLIGDSSAYTRSSPNPSVLPLIAHDTGTAAITAYTTSSQVVRFFRITHSTDGATIDARGPNIHIGHVFVNVGEPSASGSGIVVDNSNTGFSARVDSSSISKVRGYGVRFNGVVGGVIRQVAVAGVDSTPTTTGAGIEISGGSGVTVDSANVRGTGGAQVHVLNHSSAALSRLNLAGRRQLLRLVGVSGNTQVSASRFDMQLRGDETFSAGSAQDGRSGVRIDASSGVTLRDNVFVDANFGTMDGVRITGSRGAGILTNTSFGASLIRNQFSGGRYNIRSSQSSWVSEATRSTGAVRGVFGEDADIISMFADTIGTSGSGCVVVTGASSALTVRGGTFSVCAADSATTMQAAVRAAGAATSLAVDSSAISGPNTIAIDHAGGGTLSVTRNAITANGTRTLATTGTRAVIGSAGASTVTVSSNRVRTYSDLAALHVPAGAAATVSSNHFTRNKVGVRVAAGGSISATDNDWFGNDSAGVAYAGATGTIENNFWGDHRGPKRTADSTATGDSALVIQPTAVRATPVFSGTVAAELRVVRGQTTAGIVPGSVNPTATVRVIDANGNPVAGVTVSFTCSSNCGSGNTVVRLETSPTFGVTAGGNTTTRTVTTNAAGLAEVLVDLRGVAKTTIITGSATALGSVSISVTAN